MDTRHDMPAAGIADVPEIGIGRLLRRAHTSFSRVLRAKLAVHGVTFSQFQHLRTLWEEDGLSQAELSRRIGIERASSTQVIDSLHRAGLIRRERDMGDARKFKVYLTASGAGLKDALWGSVRDANVAAKAGIADGDLATMFRCVSQVIANLESIAVAEPPDTLWQAGVLHGPGRGRGSA